MKIAYEVPINASLEKVWAELLNFAAYPEWNALLPKVEGVAAPEGNLKVFMQPLGLNRRVINAHVTGFVAPKYFSFEGTHRFGKWFYHEELIFRMKEKPQGLVFFAEAYVTGLSLRFRRFTVESAFRRSLMRMADTLKERVEGAPALL